jgi:hypothetical protein
MAVVTRNIGLSLGADICWPASFEELIKRLDLEIPYKGDRVRFAVERVMVEPFDLEYKPKYDLVLDRLTHWFMTSREWVKKITLMDGVYVLNNPWSIQANEKHTSYCAMMKLGFPIPKTWIVPPKEYTNEGDTQVTVRKYNRMFNLDTVGQAVGYPNFIKPYDGGGWVGVKRCKDAPALYEAYDASGTRVHHVQASVEGWDRFIRAIGIGPQVNVVRYNPDAPLHARYMVDFNFLNGEEWVRAQRICRTINAFFSWDFNSCEMLRKDGVLYPIDFANACPDSQVQSLHYHFPWLVKALVRWSLFCATTRRPMRLNLDWKPFFDLNDPEMSFDERLVAYDKVARAHFSTDEFEEFVDQHLGDLDEIALDFFGTERFKEITRDKVAAMYPKHEVDEFTDHFFGLIQFWRRCERDRMDQHRVEGSDATAEVPLPQPAPTA